MTEPQLPDQPWEIPSNVGVTLIPQETRGRRRGDFMITAQNHSALPVDAYICARGHGLRCELSASPIHLRPGEHGWVNLSVRSAKRAWFSDAAAAPFEISCLTAGGANTSTTRSGRFGQKALIPWWSLLALALLGLALGLILAFALPNKTTVPSVTGAQSAVEAELLLQEAGLTLGSRFGRRLSEIQVGTVLAQVPRAGTEVDEDSPVSVVVAVPETGAPQTTTSAVVITDGENVLIALLPISFRDQCRAVAGAPPLSTASVYCVNSIGIELFAYQFASDADLQSSYAARVLESGATPDTGECGNDAVAEGSIESVQGVTLGRFLCTVDDQGNPLVIWTVDEQLIQLEARWQRSASELAEWWRDEGRTIVVVVETAAPPQSSGAEGVGPSEPPAPQEPSSLPEPPPAGEGAEGQPPEPIPPATETPGDDPIGGSTANGDATVAHVEAIFNERDPAASVAALGDVYYEHNPALEDGLEGVVALVESLEGADGDLVETHRVLEDGEFVALHSTYALDAALEPTPGAEAVAADIYRFDENGQIVEHWSVFQNADASAVNESGRTMVDGGGDPTANADTGANIAVVRRLYDEVYATGNAAPLEELFVEPHAEHNPDSGDGLDRYRSLVAAGPVDVEVKRIVAQGDLVLVHSRARPEGLGDSAVVDIYRLENGKIAEHWDVFQPTVPQEDSTSGNDMFAQLS